MAAADYKDCDVCVGKTFYDANITYDDDWDIKWERPWGVGDWKVICKSCAETYEVIVRKKTNEAKGRSE